VLYIYNIAAFSSRYSLAFSSTCFNLSSPAAYAWLVSVTGLASRVTAGRGVGKVEPGLEKILGVGLNFKIGICLAHSRLGVGLKKLRILCEAYAESIRRGHNKIQI